MNVTNTGGADATLGEVSAAALGLAPPFTLDSTGTTCTTGMVLAKSSVGTCRLQILLMPTEIREYRQTLELDYSWGTGETRTLSQEIVMPTAPPLDVLARSIDYGVKPLHLSAPQEYTIRNRAATAVVLGDVTEAGLGLEPPFHRTGGTCVSGQSLTAHVSCSIQISFVPTAVESFASPAVVRYHVAQSGTPELSAPFTLRGTGTVPVRVSANWPLSQPAAPGTIGRDTVTFTNWGGATATVRAVSSAALGLAPPFSLARTTCITGTTLSPNGSCTLELEFSPTAIGTFEDELTLSYNYPDGATFFVSKRLSARAEANPSTNCFDTGCAAGQVCSATATGVGTCVDVPPPPPNCMAPCLWEARRHCLPVFGACTQEATTNSTLTCDANTGWTLEVWADPTPDVEHTSSSSRRFGAECFFERQFYVPYLLAYSATYTDGSQPIAFATRDFGTRNVYCGPHTGAESGLTPFVEWLTPECLAWASQYLGQTACQSVSTGTCSGS
ncbi:MAG TPA: choice-of-anchor D domain-containing protein [Polyangiaceae bacterium]